MSKKNAAGFEETQVSLHRWATEEMKFELSAQNAMHGFQTPSAQDFKYLCSGPLDDVWKYVSRNLKSVERVRHIKKNVALKRRVGQNEAKTTDPLEDERKARSEQTYIQMTKELASVQAEISHFRNELKQALDEAIGTEKNYQKATQSVRDLERKEALLQVACKSSEETVSRYQQYSERLGKQMDVITLKRASDDTYAKDKNEQEDGMETESSLLVRHICEDMSNFLETTLESDSENDQQTLKRLQLDLLEKVSRMSSSCSIGSIVSILSLLSEHSAKDIRDETMDVNILKEAEDLSFSYSSREGLKDLSKSPNVLNSVTELLEASSMEHVMRWFEEQKHTNEEWKLTARLDDLTVDIHKHIERLMEGHAHNILLAKNLVDAKIRLAQQKSVVPSLQSEANNLIERIEKAKEQRQELWGKFEQIQNFQQVVEKKQSVILSLAKHNANAPERLHAQVEKISEYISSRSLNCHATAMRHLIDGLSGNFLAQVEKVTSHLLPCLLTVPVDGTNRRCVLDLSIAPAIHSLAYEKQKNQNEVLEALRCPTFKSPEAVLFYVLSLHHQIHDLTEARCSRQKAVAAIKKTTNTDDDIEAFVDLCQQAQSHDHRLSERLVSQLKNSLDLTKSGVKSLIEAKGYLQTWWEQPAQLMTPWVKAEDQTFDQWLKHWGVLVVQVNSGKLAMASAKNKTSRS